MSQELLRSLVWLDYRLALILTVIVPLGLSIWALVKQVDPVQRLFVIYWRVASLFMITVYLMIGAMPIAFLTGLLAAILIPGGLWFWLDLNEEISDLPQRSLKLAVTSWRWAISVYCGIGVLASLRFIPCALSSTVFASPLCQVWLEPALTYKDTFHRNYTDGFIGFWGIVGLIIYVLYLGHFVFFRLGKQGRTAIEQ